MKNWFYQGVAKFYEGPGNDIRHKLIEEAWFGREVTDDLTSISPAPKRIDVTVTPTEVEVLPPQPEVTEPSFVDLYGTDMTPVEAPIIEAPRIEAPKVGPDMNEGPDIGP